MNKSVPVSRAVQTDQFLSKESSTSSLESERAELMNLNCYRPDLENFISSRFEISSSHKVIVLDRFLPTMYHSLDGPNRLCTEELEPEEMVADGPRRRSTMKKHHKKTQYVFYSDPMHAYSVLCAR